MRRRAPTRRRGPAARTEERRSIASLPPGRAVFSASWTPCAIVLQDPCAASGPIIRSGSPAGKGVLNLPEIPGTARYPLMRGICLTARGARLEPSGGMFVPTGSPRMRKRGKTWWAVPGMSWSRRNAPSSLRGSLTGKPNRLRATHPPGSCPRSDGVESLGLISGGIYTTICGLSRENTTFCG